MQDDELGVNCCDDSAMRFDLERTGCISYLNSNSFASKWVVVLPGQFAGTFAGPDIYCHSFIFVVILLTVFLSECVPTVGIGCYRVTECSLDCSFIKPAADPSAGVSHTVLW